MFALLGMVANAQTFQKVTDVAQLADGDKVVIVYENGADSKVMGASTETYRTDVGVSISSEQFVAPEGTTILTLDKNSDGTFTFNDGTGYLEYHGASNELYTQASGGINWTVTNESIVNSNVTERYLQYNPSAKRFACYKLSSKQKNVCLYKETITTKVSVPEFSIAEGTYYNPLTIDLSCVTTDASIFYTINDGVETAYQAPIELNESGEYTIKAWATKEGLENSEVVSKTYTLKIGEQPMNLELNIGNYCTNAGIDNSDVVYEIIYNNVIFTATDGGSNSPKYYTSDKTWRIYTNGSLTITAPEGYFVETVNFEFDKNNVASADNGTWDKSSSTWTASGNTQSVKFNIGGTTEIKSITVTLKKADSNQVAAPIFSLTSGTYEGTQSLTLDCETEGATIYYTMNGGEPQTFANDAIELTEGEYAFVAWAEKDGMTKSSEVTANYTIVAPLVANSIAEFLALGAENTDRVITLNCDLTVTYQGSTSEGNTTRDLYVQDKDGKGLLIFNFDNPQLKKGDVISGVKGKYDLYNGVPELIEPVLGEVKETVEVVPVSVEASQVTVDNVNDYVVINNVELSEVNGADATLNDETATLALYNKYNACTYPEDLTKKYFVTGIVSVYKDAVQIYPMEITVDTESGVNDAVANEFKAVAVANGIEVNVAEAGLVSVYNAAGQLVANVNVAEGATTINVAAGFYIVKAGNNVAKVLVK